MLRINDSTTQVMAEIAMSSNISEVKSRITDNESRSNVTARTSLETNQTLNNGSQTDLNNLRDNLTQEYPVSPAAGSLQNTETNITSNLTKVTQPSIWHHNTSSLLG